VIDLISAAPPARYQTPGGQAMSVAMTSLGALGWVSDRRGYRYDSAHPATGQPWPPIPQTLLELWADLADPKVPPDACLVNLYRGSARMGLHQDRDEADLTFPVLSISLGDTAVFRIGGVRRSDPTVSVRLASGDACILSGEARLAFHGVDRILTGSSRLIPGGGRLNLTLRRAAPF
jgi:alkylated DNA repair protein (DNA oxidative demethylase)